MTKGAIQQKARFNKTDQTASIEHNMVLDDNLLPSADEIEKLSIIDPNILDWIKKRCEIEQDARITFNNNRMSLAKKDVSWTHYNNFFSMIFVSLIVLSALVFAFLLIKDDHIVQGSLFGASGLLVVLVTLLRSPKIPQRKQSK